MLNKIALLGTAAAIMLGSAGAKSAEDPYLWFEEVEARKRSIGCAKRTPNRLAF
ncbi:MAG: hypothetical protein R3C42_08710 [Parvularculaceae bacterium]